MKKLLTILYILVSIYSEANTYYFSNAGSDSYTSAQAQNPSTAWATIDKLNSYFSSLHAGDVVLFRRGDTFYGSISSTVSGGSGNPITFGAYGSGAAPKISSAVVISSWTALGGGIYESTSAITPTPESAIKMVTIGGVEYAMGRTPNANAANSGYLTFESHTSSSITDNTNPFTSAYNGSTLVARATQGNLDQNTVTTISGNVINFSGSFDNGLINNFGYFLENTLQSLDQYGEWYYNTTTHKLDIFFGSSGTSPITVSTKNMLMNLDHNYFSVDGINFQYANMYGIFASNNPSFGLNINNCSFTFCGINGVGVYNRNTITIDSCSFNWCNAAGVNTGTGDTLATVTNSTFSNIATFQGMLFPDIGNQRYGMGIFSENGLTCINNRFNNIGYVPIYFTKSNNLIQYNYVDTFCTILADGGGIYTYNYKPGGVLSTYINRVIRDNIVLHGIGAKNGTFDSDPTYNPAEGIYIDDNSMNVDVINNTVAYCADAGIYLHNSPDGIITGNVLYENGGGLLTQHGDPNLDVSGITFKKNQIFTTGTGTNRLILNLRSQNNDFLSTGTFDSNYYCKPFDTTNLIQTNWFSHATTTYHLSNWKTATSKDAHTVQTPVPVSSSSDILFLYNETGANKNNNLGGNTYKSVTGNTYAGSITLTPFTSQILLKIPSDTTYYTYHIQHDTLKRTTIPEKINLIGYKDSTIFDTSYNSYSIYKTYWNVDGSITITIALYDTVPAHDSVFICTLCASHDTTVVTALNHQVTIAADNQSKALGSTFTFTHNGDQVSVVGGSLIAGDVITVDNAASSGASSGAASGSYPITLSSVTIMRGATDVTSTYNITYLNGTLAVAGAIPLTIRADNQSKAYGQTFTFTHDASQVSITSGVLNTGDVITVDNAASTSSASNANVGTYSISLSSVTIMNGATNVTANYAITYQAGSLTVTSAPLTVRANNEGKTAGQTFTFTNDGSQVSVTSGSLISGDAIIADNAASTGAASTAIAGTYPITLSSVTIRNGATNVTGNYSITYQTGTLTVAAAALIITVAPKPQSKVYGSTFTFTNNGTQVNVISGSLQSGDVITVDNSASSGAVSTANAGSYTITLSSITIMNGATNVTGNYTISYQTNTLTVNTKPITVKANNQTKTWNSTFTFTHNGSQVSVTSGSLVSGHAITVDNAASTGAVSSANAGTYNITLSSVTITNGATDVTANYAITYAPGTLTVTTIPLTVKANNQSKVQGNAFIFLHNGTQVTIVSGSLVSGNAITVDNAASTGSGAGVPTGSYPITLSSVTITSGATNVTANYFITYQGGTLSVSAAAEPIVYGMFPNNGETTLTQRLNATVQSASNAYRYNFDLYSSLNWQIPQIRNAGLGVQMTVNSDLVQPPINAFPTGTELSRRLFSFDSLLTANAANLPDVIYIQNEEPNPNYWSGKPQDYMAWLNGCVTISHNHGVKISNGGLLVNVAYYVRAVWRSEGKTDSANLITKLGGLPVNVAAAQQAVIDWYSVEIPALTASNIDYVNQHWYEPTFFLSNNSDTASGMLPLVINFLQSRVGKPVVTHEWGTGSNSQALFNQTADEWKNAGVKIMIYYDGTEAGTDPNSIAHPEFWRAWILMQ